MSGESISERFTTTYDGSLQRSPGSMSGERARGPDSILSITYGILFEQSDQHPTRCPHAAPPSRITIRNADRLPPRAIRASAAPPDRSQPIPGGGAGAGFEDGLGFGLSNIGLV